DIVAKFSPNASGDTVPAMLQTLLKERFHRTFHREARELPTYALTVAKNGPKFATAETASGITSNSNRSRWQITAKISMRSFAEFLSPQAGRPVIDKTGLPGTYELKLEWSIDDAPAGNEGPSLFTALQEQLGLKLESAKGPVEALVVDHADKAPTEN